PTDGANWTATINPSDFAYGAGSQYFGISALRASDGKVAASNSSAAVQFCPAAGCSGLPLPTATISSVPSAVSITTGGSLASDVLLRVNSTNVTSADSVPVPVQTQAGAVTLWPPPDPLAAPCPAPTAAAAGVARPW